MLSKKNVQRKVKAKEKKPYTPFPPQPPSKCYLRWNALLIVLSSCTHHIASKPSMQAFPLWLVIMLDSRRNKILMVFGTLMAASLLPFVSTSPLDKHKFVPKHRTNQPQPLKGNPQLEFHIKLHALLLWASIGVLMPVGIIIVRMSRRVQGIKMLKALFYAHVIVQFTAILLATAAAVLALMNFDNSLNNTHQRIGFVLYILIWLHPLVAFVRPQRGIKIRSIWYLLHWLLGTGVCVLGMTNIYIGLNAYHEKMSRSVSLWKKRLLDLKKQFHAMDTNNSG